MAHGRSRGKASELEVPYEAGGAYATVEGAGELHVTLDGTELTPIDIDSASSLQAH